jgi:hypothetical protein
LTSVRYHSGHAEQSAHPTVAVDSDFSRSVERMNKDSTINPDRTEAPVVTTTNRARGAVTGHHANTVLIVSTLAVIVIFGGLLLYYLH